MKIVWDEIKRRANLDKHGFDFADLDEAFFAAALVVPAKDGRQMPIGTFRGEVVIATVFARSAPRRSRSCRCAAPIAPKGGCSNDEDMAPLRDEGSRRQRSR